MFRRSSLETAIAAVRHQLGETQFAARWSEGAAMAPDGAVVLALDSSVARGADDVPRWARQAGSDELDVRDELHVHPIITWVAFKLKGGVANAVLLVEKMLQAIDHRLAGVHADLSRHLHVGG